MSIHDQLALVAVVLGFLMLADTARDIIQGPYRRWLRRRYEAERIERMAHDAWWQLARAFTPPSYTAQIAAAAVRNARAFQDGMDRVLLASQQSNNDLKKLSAAFFEFGQAARRPKPGPGLKRPLPGPGHKETV